MSVGIQNQDLAQIWDELALILAVVGGSGSGAQNIASSTLTVGVAIIPAGAYSISLNTSDDFIGSIAGVSRSAGSTIFFQASPGKTLNSVSYAIAAGSMVLDTITNA